MPLITGVPIGANVLMFVLSKAFFPNYGLKLRISEEYVADYFVSYHESSISFRKVIFFIYQKIYLSDRVPLRRAMAALHMLL